MRPLSAYLAAARSPTERRARRDDILGAYDALLDLRRSGAVKAVGVGAKDWRVLRWIADRVDLDWVMPALSLTLLRHPPALLRYVNDLARRKVAVINSAVFHGGFLGGGAFFDYRKIDPTAAADRALLRWRERFLAVCRQEGVGPAEACIQAALAPPGVVSVALNTSRPGRIRRNVAAVQAEIPQRFWTRLRDEALLSKDFPCSS